MTELIILCSNRTEEEIKRVIAYLIKEFPMAKDGGLTYRKTIDTDLKSAGWIGVIPTNKEYWAQFIGTIEKMRQAARDYENGWCDAKKG